MMNIKPENPAKRAIMAMAKVCRRTTLSGRPPPTLSSASNIFQAYLVAPADLMFVVQVNSGNNLCSLGDRIKKSQSGTNLLDGQNDGAHSGIA